MGGYLFILTFGSNPELFEWIDKYKDWVFSWSEAIERWKPTDVCRKRFIWLRCEGIPLHAWCKQVFASIGNLWGSFIKMDEITESKEKFDAERIIICTSMPEILVGLVNFNIGPPLGDKLPVSLTCGRCCDAYFLSFVYHKCFYF